MSQTAVLTAPPASMPDGVPTTDRRRSLLVRALATAGVVALLAVVELKRRPAGLQAPAIWAEDGRIFLGRAWEGLQAIALPYAGEMWPVQRVLALIIGLFDATRWPLLTYTTACLLVAASAGVLLQRRARQLFGPLPFRLLAMLLVVLLPATFETQGNLANVHLFMAGSLLVLLALPAPATRPGRILELLYVGVLSITGPVGLLMIPVAIWRLLIDRSRYLLVRSALVFISAAVVTSVGLIGGRAEAHSCIPETSRPSCSNVGAARSPSATTAWPHGGGPGWPRFCFYRRSR